MTHAASEPAPWEAFERRLALGNAPLRQRAGEPEEPEDDLPRGVDLVEELVAQAVAAERARCERLLRERDALEADVVLVADLREAGRSAAAPVPQPAPPRVAGLAADLRELAATVTGEARAYTARAEVLERLAGSVVRTDRDTRGATPWTQLVREVAVALRTSERRASGLLDDAVLLRRRMPRTEAALREGRLPVAQALELVSKASTATDPLFVAHSPDGGASAVAAVDALADEAAERRSWSVWRVRQQADAVLLQADADAAAALTAQRAAGREVRLRTRNDRRTAEAPSDAAELVLDGPALVLQQVAQALDTDARALQGWLHEQGDRRALGALRFDLAVHRLLGDHAPARPGEAGAGELWERFHAVVGADRLPDPSSPSWWTDRRFTRPVQLQPLVPVTTLLGLSQEPGWVPGVGWVSAPTVRQLLPVAELRQVCVDGSTGQVVDLAERVVRPQPTVEAVRQTLTDFCTRPFAITDSTWRAEGHYRPSVGLADLARLRDGLDDGPTGSTVGVQVGSRRGGELDHERAYDDAEPARGGPTAAFNLVLRGQRTHQLKHDGWVPVRTASGTTWTSPLGQVVTTPPWRRPLAPLLADAQLPDPADLHALETELLRPPDEDDVPPF